MVDKVEVQFGGQLTGLTAAVNQATEEIEGLTAPVTSLTNAFGAFAEVAMAAFAVDKIVDFVAEMARAGQEVLDTSKELGLSTETVSTLNVAFQAMGMDSQSASQGLMRLSRAQEMAEMGSRQQMAAFQVLGITMDQLKTMSPEDMLNKLADVFSRTADGTNKTALAMTLLGRAGAQMIPFLDKGREGLEQFEAIARETGTVWTQSMAEGAEKTSVEISTLDDAFKGVGITLFETFKPAIDVVVNGLIELVEGFNNALKGSGLLHDGLEILVVSIEAVIAALATLVAALTEAYQIASFTAGALITGWTTVANVISDVFHGNFAQAKADAASGLDQIEQSFKTHLDAMLAAGKDWQQAMKGLLAGAFGQAGAGESDETGGAPKPQVQSMGDFYQSGQGQKQYMQDWQADLDKMLIAQNLFFDRAKQAEQAYWSEKLAYVESHQAAITASYVQAGSTQSQAEDKTDQLILALRQKMYAFDQDALTQWLTQYKSGLEEQQATLKQQLAAGLITQQQYHAQSVALWQDWAQVVGQTYGTTSTQYAAAMKDIENANKQATAKTQSDWTAAIDTINRSMDQMLQGILQGTQSWQQAMARVFSNLATSFIEAVAKMMLQWTAFEVMGIGKNPIAAGAGGLGGMLAGWMGGGAAGGGNPQNAAMTQLTTALTGQTAATTLNTGGITNWIGQQISSLASWLGLTTSTTSQTVATTAQTATTTAGLIPAIVALTAALTLNTAAVGMSSAGSSLGAAGSLLNLASFDVGAYRVPATMIAQIHEDEMIIPAAEASMVRAGQASVGAGGFPAAGAGAAGGVTVIVAPNFNVQAWNGQDAVNALKNQGRAIAQIVANEIVSGNSSLKSALAKG